MDVIWLRRGLQGQAWSRRFDDPYRDVIDRDSESALAGCLMTCFDGVWISDPAATIRAGNKLIQLELARTVGLRVPETLVTQSRGEVTDFLDAHGGRVVVKSLRGLPYQTIYTRLVKAEHLTNYSDICATPAIYQEFIDGTRHLRFVVLGDRVWFFEIDSDSLDWREDPHPRIHSTRVPHGLTAQTLRVVHGLGLLMGVGDFKVAPSGDPVWLEVNPQGQFLFLQEATKIDLAAACGDFILASATARATPAGDLRAF